MSPRASNGWSRSASCCTDVVALDGVLGQRVIPVRAPYLVRQVPVVMHLEPGGDELFEQAGRAQRRGRQVLAGRIAGRAARNAHD